MMQLKTPLRGGQRHRRWSQIEPKAFLLPSFLPRRLAAVNKTCREQLAVIFIPSHKILSRGEEDAVIILNVNLFNCEKLLTSPEGVLPCPDPDVTASS